jgi:hypothetical protein
MNKPATNRPHGTCPTTAPILPCATVYAAVAALRDAVEELAGLLHHETHWLSAETRAFVLADRSSRGEQTPQTVCAENVVEKSDGPIE